MEVCSCQQGHDIEGGSLKEMSHLSLLLPSDLLLVLPIGYTQSEAGGQGSPWVMWAILLISGKHRAGRGGWRMNWSGVGETIQLYYADAQKIWLFLYNYFSVLQNVPHS